MLGEIETVKRLIEDSDYQIDCEKPDGSTPLILSVIMGHFNVTKVCCFLLLSFAISQFFIKKNATKKKLYTHMHTVIVTKPCFHRSNN